MSRNLSLADSDSYNDMHDEEQRYNGIVPNGSGSQATSKKGATKSGRTGGKKSKGMGKSSGSPKSDSANEEERLKELERERKRLEKENAERKRKLDRLKEEEKASLEAAEKGM